MPEFEGLPHEPAKSVVWAGRRALIYFLHVWSTCSLVIILYWNGDLRKNILIILVY
jgi:hypothetical protein